MKILIPVDGSTYSDEAVKEIAQRPWPTGSEVRIISVVEPPPPPPTEAWVMAVETDLLEAEEWRRKHAQAAVEAAIQTIRSGVDKTLNISSDILLGIPKQVILDESESWGADLIMVGSHGYGFWERVVLGSVSQAVASHAKCSVEIVRRRRVGSE